MIYRAPSFLAVVFLCSSSPNCRTPHPLFPATSVLSFSVFMCRRLSLLMVAGVGGGATSCDRKKAWPSIFMKYFLWVGLTSSQTLSPCNRLWHRSVVATCQPMQPDWPVRQPCFTVDYIPQSGTKNWPLSFSLCPYYVCNGVQRMRGSFLLTNHSAICVLIHTQK